ncbi:MAG: hypothetical protein ABI409_13715 [Ramlibacter sp.]
MLTVEAKLARWRAFYGELGEAEQRLRQAQGSQRAGGATTAQLEVNVRDLQQRCDCALDEVGAALAARRSPHAGRGSPAASQPA